MNTMRHAVAALAAIGMFVAMPSSAQADGESPPSPNTQVISTAVAAPFNLEVSRRGVLVADGGLNLIGKVGEDGSLTTVAADQPGASGVALSRNRKTMAFATTDSNPDTHENSASGLHIWGPRGQRSYIDTFAYETAHNPDGVIRYGVTDPSPCVTDAFNAAGIPVSYEGLLDSHAYSVAAYRGGWLVADAGANVVWQVDRDGTLSTLTVLPAQPLTFTAEHAQALGLPACVVGVTYLFESVPTDVEVGADGKIYISTLPGGPESPALGARGAVFSLNAKNGKLKTVATGFLGATNIALAANGDIYVAELFASKISVVHRGQVSTFLDLPGVVAVETYGGSVWAATMGDPGSQTPGTIVEVPRRRT